MSAIPWRLGVVIPAHDEAERIRASVEATLAALPEGRDSWVVVVADACRDNTEAIARAALSAGGEVIRTAGRCVGAARRAGAAAVARRFAEEATSRVWLLSTDADTRVPADWVEGHLALANQGAAAVAGVVEVDSWEGHSPDTCRRFAEAYALPSNGEHAFVHGANLGVRLDAYLDVGGWPPLPRSEDRRLWSNLQQREWRTVPSVASVVRTSGRMDARVPGGFGAWLRSGLVSPEEADKQVILPATELVARGGQRG